MDTILPSFMRVVRKLDKAEDLIALFPDVEEKSRSDPSAISPQDRIRILDFPDEDQLLSNIAKSSSHTKSGLLRVAAETPEELTESEEDLLKGRFWLGVKFYERKAWHAASEVLSTISQEYFGQVKQRLEDVRAPLYAENELQAIENAQEQSHRRVIAASNAYRAEQKLRAEQSLGRAQPWVRRMWEEEKGETYWGYAVYRKPLFSVDEAVFQREVKNANSRSLTDAQKAATLKEEFECRKDNVMLYALGATGVANAFGLRNRDQSMKWPEEASLKDTADPESFQQTMRHLRQHFKTVRAKTRRPNPDRIPPIETGGLQEGILSNVFLYLDQDTMDLVFSDAHPVDDIWCYAVDPDFDDDKSEQAGEDTYPGYLKVRIQQLVNRFFEARKYRADELSLEQLWKAAQKSRNQLFVSWKDDELTQWRPSRDVGSVLRSDGL